MSKIENLLSELLAEVDYELSAGRMELSEAVSAFIAESKDPIFSGDFIIPESVLAPIVKKGQFYNNFKDALCATRDMYHRFHAVPTLPDTKAVDEMAFMQAADIEAETPIATPAPAAAENTSAELFDEFFEALENKPGTPKKKRGGADMMTKAERDGFTGGERMREMVVVSMYVEMNANGIFGGRHSDVQKATEKFMREHDLLLPGDTEKMATSPSSTYTVPRVWRQATNALQVLVPTGYVKKTPSEGNYYLTEKGKQWAKEIIKKEQK